MTEIEFEVQDPTEEEAQRELGFANLSRMRGDYHAATAQCLSLLKRKPDQLDAHTLLGDINAEQGDLEQAAQWYELALDLNRDSITDQKKLQVTRERMKEREAAATAQSLGLPSGQQKLRVYIAGFVAAIILLGFGAYLVGQRSVSRHLPTDEGLTKVAPLEGSSAVDVGVKSGKSKIGLESGTVSETTTGPATNSPTTGTAPERNPLLVTEEDKALMALISPKMGDTAHLLTASFDPRLKQSTVSFQIKAEDDERKVAAEVAKITLDASPETSLVVLRAVRSEHLVFMADVTRTKLIESQAPTFAQQNTGADAWINFVLTNEWTDSKGGMPNPSTASPPAGP